MALVYPDGEVLWIPPVDIKVKTCVDKGKKDKNKDKKDKDKKYKDKKTKTKKRKDKDRELVLFIPPVDIKVKTCEDVKEFYLFRPSVLTSLIRQDQW